MSHEELESYILEVLAARDHYEAEQIVEKIFAKGYNTRALCECSHDAVFSQIGRTYH